MCTMKLPWRVARRSGWATCWASRSCFTLQQCSSMMLQENSKQQSRLQNLPGDTLSVATLTFTSSGFDLLWMQSAHLMHFNCGKDAASCIFPTKSALCLTLVGAML